MDNIVKDSIELAKKWQSRANELILKEEAKMKEQMTALLDNPSDKAILIQMIDQSFRANDYGRVADQLEYVLKKEGIPKFLSYFEKVLMQLFLHVGKRMPFFSIPKVIAQIRNSSSYSVIPGEDEPFYKHLDKRAAEKVLMNVNFLGEAVLGEDESLFRLDSYIKALKDPKINYISVKISTIYSQISSIAFENTVDVLVERLSQLYKVALNNFFIDDKGQKRCKFVNLDMEEYRDMEITAELFMRTLDKEEFKNLSAGIVLQAYIPDSHLMQQKITKWAKQRCQEGGAPIKIRIVKGANMEMEKLESSHFNWSLAPFDNKKMVDANFKKMVDYAVSDDNMKSVNIGVGSHNLFELAYAYLQAKKNDLVEYFDFEMLEGMANHVRRAITENYGKVVIYAPVAKQEQFINAIGYLVRRLDENTGDENFLRYSSNLIVGSKDWNYLEKQFADSYDIKDSLVNLPHRKQNRQDESFLPKGTYHEKIFYNEADTDFTCPANRDWCYKIKDEWKKDENSEPFKVPIVVGGEEIYKDNDLFKITDSSMLSEKKDVLVALCSMAEDEEILKSVQVAKEDKDSWRSKTYEERHKFLSKAAEIMRTRRGDLIGAAMANTGKIVTEADVEVSEAIDFVEFYPFSAKYFDEFKNIKISPKGVGLVVSPWNFPIAIPVGGMAASLAAGNTVIFKPASDAMLVGYLLCKCFWDAGISKNTLQFLPSSGSKLGSLLINNPDINFVILTGGTETALKMLETNPSLSLSAETGGKNATIVTSMADRDQAIKNVLHSAFSNVGQKCSATSLLVLEKEVYYDEHFKKQLVDAAKSLKIGSAWNLENKIGPLIKAPEGDLKRALTELDEGEYWALKPKMVEDNPYIWSPGIKYGVKFDSYSHKTEFFGPILSVMCAENLEDAIRIVNATDYGLTSGIESLDEREQEIWSEKIIAGNLYINRGTTGAIVLRQPFGGMKKSAVGQGAKAGSPNYVTQFMNIEEKEDFDFSLNMSGIIDDHRLLWMINEWKVNLDWDNWSDVKEDIKKSIKAIQSYIFNAENEFFVEKDYFHLIGQDNIFRYRSIFNMTIRLHPDDSLFETIARIAAAKIACLNVELSIPDNIGKTRVIEFLESRFAKILLEGVNMVYENDSQLGFKITNQTTDRIRYAKKDRVPEEIFKTAAKVGFYISRNDVFCEGRIELLQYFREQSICNNYHRYGNLGKRGM